MTRIILVLAMVAAFLLVGLVLAQSGGGFDLSWSTVDGGGTESSGGGYTLTGTAGQPDAGGVHSGGGYALVGGFWAATAAISVSPSAAVPALAGWGLWVLAGLLLLAILAKTLHSRKSVLPGGTRDAVAGG